jgi:hypothetical protein
MQQGFALYQDPAPPARSSRSGDGIQSIALNERITINVRDLTDTRKDLMALSDHAARASFKAVGQTSTEHPHNTYGPRLNIAIWFLTGVAAIFLGLRLYCKRIRRNKLWWDDYVLIAAFVRFPFPSGLI